MPRKTDEWFVPRRSENGTTCVQTKFTDDAVQVRNNLTPDAGTATFTHQEWTTFIASVKDGDYDL
ncbi:DUF397 domain-containing protein [Amycolatopsis antarctica]|uniref:DUF397 domain-containing protein n=1 Tax=Amycolatopsis antarctica TaxID=1854586 RepID=A0A263CXN0_9PSEU|nr:DUF397 domain-containing protein [Amycolatopsis antarctica]OZM70910.1 DUF397 domain-containing protein [Amycolatopsis antarctica]